MINSAGVSHADVPLSPTCSMVNAAAKTKERFLGFRLVFIVPKATDPDGRTPSIRASHLGGSGSSPSFGRLRQFFNAIARKINPMSSLIV